MRCAKARELYFGNHDGRIDEAQRMKLQAHLDRCPGCTSFVEEMDRCFDMIEGLPELTPSENFEWNLKRRILQEKSRLMRNAGGGYLRDVRWGLKFVSSAAAVIVVSLIGAWFLLGDEPGTPEFEGFTNRSMTVRTAKDSSTPRFYPRGFTGLNRSPGIQRVSEGGRGHGSDPAIVGPMPFEDASPSREDSLIYENENLKLYIRRMERENLLLRQHLHRYRTRR